MFIFCLSPVESWDDFVLMRSDILTISSSSTMRLFASAELSP